MWFRTTRERLAMVTALLVSGVGVHVVAASDAAAPPSTQPATQVPASLPAAGRDSRLAQVKLAVGMQRLEAERLLAQATGLKSKYDLYAMDTSSEVRYSDGTATLIVRYKPGSPGPTIQLPDGNRQGYPPMDGEVLSWEFAAAVTSTPQPERMKELIEALAGGHEELAARKAYKELRLSGSAAVPYLTEAVKDKRRNVRWLAVEALGAIGGPETVPALIEAMGDPDKDVRRYAATFLGQVGGGDAPYLAALHKGLKDEDTEVVLHVLWSLDRVGDKPFRQDEELLARLLAQLTQGQTAWAAQCLGIVRNEKAVELLVQALRTKPETAQNIAQALAEIHSQKAVPGLVAILKEKGLDSRSVWEAAKTLQTLADPSVTAELLALTDSSLPWSSLAAVKALGFAGNKAAVARLSQLAADVTQDNVRREEALRALGQTEEPSAVPALGKAATDPEERLANEAVMALGSIKSPEAAAILRSRLKAESCGHVMYAVTSLGRIGDLSDAQAILEVFDRKDALDGWHSANPRMANVATACQAALADITKTQLTDKEKLLFVIGTPQQLQEVREAWRQTLARLNAAREIPEDVKLIRKTYLRNPDKPVNASSGEAVAAAVRIFKNVDFIGMRREAVLALLGDPKTISDYGVVAKKGKNEPLVYRFDSGFGGWQFTLHFKDDVVTRLQTEGME